MKLNFFSIILCSLVLSVSAISCLDNDESEYSSDDTVHVFEIDKIGGASYEFTIDQVNLRIFNIDSVPYSADTIINKIRITKFTTASPSDYLITGDTLFHYATDSLDLSGTMENPLLVKVYAPNGKDFKEYAIEVRIHQQDPDSLVWGEAPYAGSFSGGAIANRETKAVILNGKILIYASDGTNTTMYEGPDSNSPWKSPNTDLSADAKIPSILNCDGILYAATADGKVLSSADGTSWKTVASDTPVETLLTVFTGTGTDGNPVERIAGIIQEGTERYFSLGTLADGALTWEKGEEVREDFPTENMTAVRAYESGTSSTLYKSILTGKPNTAGATATIPWFSLEGLRWRTLDSEKENSSLPAMTRPTPLYYGNAFYVFGDDFSTIYTSKNGIDWDTITEKFLFPCDDEGVSIFKGRDTRYSMVVDEDNYIWMVWNEPDEVWRAKLNRLGFLIQD